MAPKGSAESDAPSREEAQARLDQAQEELRAAADRAAEAGQAVAATVMQNVPEMEVVVLPNQTVSHNDKVYYGEGYPLAPEDHPGGDTLTLDGPTALALMQSGKVRIKGEAS